MRKGLLIMIAVLLVSALVVSCNSDISESVANQDSLAKVTVLSSSTKALQTYVSGSTDVEDLYWYYTATKTDGSLFTTGQTTEKKLIDNFNPAGDPAKTHGLKDADLGLFSTGSWSFSFWGYKSTTDIDGTTNKPVYYQENLSATVTTTTNLTVTLVEGEGMGDATIKFSYGTGENIQYPNWTYAGAPDETSLTLCVYDSDPDAVPAPKAIAYDTKTTTNGHVDFSDLEDVSLPAGTNILYFRVMYGTECVGSFNLGLNVKKGTTVSVYGSIEHLDSTYHVYVRTVNKTTVEATIISENVGRTITEGSESTSDAASGTTAVVTTKSPQNAASSTVTANAALETGTKVTLPSVVLETNSSNTEGTTTTNKTVSHDLTVDVKSENLAETAFEIKAEDEGSTPVAGIDLTLVKTTTTTVTVKDSTEENANVLSTSTDIATAVVDTFKSGNDDVYVTIDTYIAKGLSDVKVRYIGELDTHVFNEAYATAMLGTLGETDTSGSNSGTGYDPATGRLVFKTPHFSSFYVISKPVAEIIEGSTSKLYGSLEEAFSSAVSGQTIKLLVDYTITNGYYSHSNPLYVSVANTTFDLNGKTITTYENMAFGSNADGVTIKNGTIVGMGPDSYSNFARYPLMVNDCKNVVLDSLTVTGGIAIGGDPNGGYTPNAGAARGVVVKNCNVTQSVSASRYALFAQNGSTVTIDSGTYSGSSSGNVVLYAGFSENDGGAGHVYVKGGYFSGSLNPSSNSDYIIITGGYFTTNPVGLTAEGYEAVSDTSVTGYSYTVQEESECSHNCAYEVIKNYWSIENNKYVFYELRECANCEHDYTHRHDLSGMYCNKCKHMIPFVVDSFDLEDPIKNANGSLTTMASTLFSLDEPFNQINPFDGSRADLNAEKLYFNDFKYLACFNNGKIVELINENNSYIEEPDGVYTPSDNGDISSLDIANKFSNYNVDFTLTFNVPIDIRWATLGGSYNDWYFAILPAYSKEADNIKAAGTPIPIMGSVNYPITYSFLDDVSFLCGLLLDGEAVQTAFDQDFFSVDCDTFGEFLNEATVTLRLVMTAPGSSEDIVVNTIVVPFSNLMEENSVWCEFYDSKIVEWCNLYYKSLSRALEASKASEDANEGSLELHLLKDINEDIVFSLKEVGKSYSSEVYLDGHTLSGNIQLNGTTLRLGNGTVNSNIVVNAISSYENQNAALELGIMDWVYDEGLNDSYFAYFPVNASNASIELNGAESSLSISPETTAPTAITQNNGTVYIYNTDGSHQSS